ncbi:hypothetical protein ACH5RR_040362 [Cinchona calisaya]|uniref:Bifunctional inhibitor/plant lipid transfer protein/seed storage helical domain-containing protein n=1 Tax=Cinchona calisaya TaxID=153742 RepID=A0ABD2XU96_9GENT
MHEAKVVHGQPVSPGRCKEEVRLVTNACRPVVFGKAASPGCCERVRVSHFECVCPMFTPKLATLLNVNQVIKLLQGCGRRVPRRFKCGSLNFP